MKNVLGRSLRLKELSFLLAVILLISCRMEHKSESTEMKNIPGFEKKHFGQLPSGEEVFEYVLSNGNGMEVAVITYGGIIRSILVPDREGNPTDVVLGYDNLQGYLDNNPYFGAIVGRYGNRIAQGRFSIDGQSYQLAANNLGNHLHGGIKGFDKVLWLAEPEQTGTEVSLRLNYLSQDKEEGYPGDLNVTVVYRLTGENELMIEYEATTDQKTVVNLTSHSYFNLTGGKADILEHQLMINAANYLPVDSTLIPLEMAQVAGTPFDFTSPKTVGSDIESDNDQLTHGGGFDHCWVLEASDVTMNLAATLFDPISGIHMELYTEEPGLQFYSGNFLDGSIRGKGDVTYGSRSGLCLETQHFPNSPNRPDFPSTVLNPGEVYRTKTVHRFSVK